MRIIPEEEKLYKSVYMYPVTVKEDIKYFNNKYPFKYKFDWISIILLALAIAFFGLAVVIPFIWIGGIVALMGAIYLKYRFINKKRVAFLDHYEKAIVSNGKINYPDSNMISALYPVYILCDNDKKTFKLIYQDKEYIYCEYDDILTYRILQDRVEVNGNRLPDNPDQKIKSYIFELTFNNKKKAEIGFNNTVSKFIVNARYSFQLFANTEAINRIANVIDRIIKKNKV